MVRMMNSYEKTEAILYALSKYLVALNVSEKLGTDAEITDATCKAVNGAIRLLSNKGIEILDLYYRQGLPLRYIAKKYNVNVSTIARRKKALVQELSILLFPDDSIVELFNR